MDIKARRPSTPTDLARVLVRASESPETPGSSGLAGRPLVRNPVTAEDLLAEAMGGSALHSGAVANPATTPPTITTPPNIMTPKRHSLAAPAQHPSLPRSPGDQMQPSTSRPQPMLFGASNSMWGPGPKETPPPVGRSRNRQSAASSLQIAPGHPYSMSQSQIGLSHHIWGRPQDMFGGSSGQRNAHSPDSQQRPSTQDTYTAQQTFGGSPNLLPAFNPAVGSPALARTAPMSLHATSRDTAPGPSRQSRLGTPTTSRLSPPSSHVVPRNEAQTLEAQLLQAHPALQRTASAVPGYNRTWE